MVRFASSARSALSIGKVLGLALFVGLFTLLALSESALAWAPRYDQYIERLRNLPVDYESDGVICEQVARLELQERYPDAYYEIVTGITYGFQSVVRGELDIVVFDRRSREAVLVAEVKCSIHPGRARQHASKQRERFMQSTDRYGLNLWKEKEQYSPHQFRNLRRFLLIGPKGTLAYGFDFDLKLSLNEFKELRRAMMDCQRNGYCKTGKPLKTPRKNEWFDDSLDY